MRSDKNTEAVPANVYVHGGAISITVYSNPTEDGGEDLAAGKTVRIHEIHNETHCENKTYHDAEEVETAQVQHAYDTSPHAQELQTAARTSVTAGTIVIEIHNETKLLQSTQYKSKAAQTKVQPGKKTVSKAVKGRGSPTKKAADAATKRAAGHTKAAAKSHEDVKVGTSSFGRTLRASSVAQHAS